MQKETSEVGRKAEVGYVCQGHFKSFVVETHEDVRETCRSVVAECSQQQIVRDSVMTRADALAVGRG